MNPQQSQQPDPLIEELRPDLKKVLSERVDCEAAEEKQRQFSRLDKADNYYRGNQYLAEKYNPETGALGWVSPGAPRAGDSETPDVLDYVIDVVKSYGRKYYSVLGTRPFHNVKGVPDDPQNEDDRAASRQYDLTATFLKSKWNARVMNIMVFYHQWKSGNVYAFIDHVADKNLWGETSEPIMEAVPTELSPAGYICTSCGQKTPAGEIPPAACAACGAPLSDFNFEEAETADVPTPTGEVRKYANAGPRLTLCTGYQVTLPQDARTLDTAPWMLYEYEEHPGAILQLYREELKDKVDENGEIKTDIDGQIHEQGRRSRATAASIGGRNSSEGKKSRWTYSRYWLAPFMFEYISDKQKRASLYENYPDGLKITRVEGHIVKLENEAITDSWAVFEPEPGDYLYKDPVCWGILGNQDITNDMANIMISILERILPSMIVDPDVIDIDQLGERNHLSEILPAKAGVGARLENAFAKVPTASFPDHAPQMMGLIEQNLQSHTGLLPTVFGGDVGKQTAEEARTKLNQALSQLAVPGEFTGVGWKNTLEIAVKKIKKYGLKAGAIATGNGNSDLFDLGILSNGNAHFDNEPGVPMSWGERRDQLNLIIGQNPAMAHALGLDAPNNIAVLRDFLMPGMDELQIPGEERREKILETIRELVKQQPVGDMPTILPEPGVDDPMDAGLVLDWLRGDAGRKAARENAAGRENVRLFGMAMAMLPPPMGTPPPMLEPGPGGPGGPPPMGPPPGGPSGPKNGPPSAPPM